MKSVNIAIIGGGLAGSTVGYYLKKKGISDVTIFEEKKLPREKLCGGIISNKSKTELLNVFTEEEFESLSLSKFKNAEIVANQKSTKINCGEINIIERKNFDYEISKKYLQLGGNLVEEDKVILVDKNKKTIKLESGQEYKYNICIIATGIFSIEKDKKLKKHYKNFSLEQVISKEFIKDEYRDRFIISFDDEKHGYGWVIPRGDFSIIGIGNTNGETEITKEMELFLQKVTNLKTFNYKGAFLPSGKNIFLGGNNVFYIGDASGIISPITGEGIYYSLFTARILAESILEGNVEESYVRSCSKIIKRVRKELFFSKFIYNKFMQRIIFTNSDIKLFKILIDKIATEFIIG